MDVKVSRKETRYQPQGPVSVLVDNITDFFVIHDQDDPLIITDIEVITDLREETLDQGMWAAFKQRGADPIDPLDGNQYEECMLGEVSPIVLMSQIMANVSAVGTGVQVDFDTSVVNNKEYLTARVFLTNSV